MKKKLIALLLGLAMMLTLLSGCGSTASSETDSDAASESAQTAEEESAQEESQEAAQSEAAQEEETDAAEEEPAAEESEEAEQTEEAAQSEESEAAQEEPAASISYPLEGDDLTLSVFTSFPGNLTSYMSTFNDHPGIQMAEEATGVKIEFTEVSMENASTQFELMVASDNFTDIVLGLDDMYVGGATSAYEQEVVYDIADMIAEYAPDYLNAINSQEDYADLVYEQDGTMLAVYGLYLYDYTAVSNGLFIRQDWLDDLGLDVPVTYDDWYEVLTAFKNDKGADAALVLPTGSESSGAAFAGGYETAGYSVEAKMTGQHFFQKDGVVTSSLVDSNYRDYLEMLNQWYEEGLIYQDFYSNDTRDVLDALVYENSAGIFSGKVDYITKYESGDSTGTIRLTGITFPVKNEGEINKFGNYVSVKSSASITTACDNPELALMWMNYFFTDEGILLANYGEEGVSYELNADGEPEFTDLILNNEDPELQFGNVTRLYLLDEVFPTVYDQTRELAAYSEAERAAIDTWTNSTEAVYTLPDLTLSTEANEEFSAKLVDVETYASENILKFIIGEKDLSEWDEFVQQLRDTGLDRCIEIYQEALDNQ